MQKKKKIFYTLPERSWKNPSTLACFGYLRIWGKKEEAAANSVSAPIRPIATPKLIVIVLACHHGLGISQKL